MFNSIILTLGITIIFADNATIPCGHIKEINGCYNYQTNTMILGYNSDDINRTFYHEMAHAMFEDEFPYNEEIAIEFVKYIRDKDFKNKQPELYWLFNNKLKQIWKLKR